MVTIKGHTDVPEVMLRTKGRVAAWVMPIRIACTAAMMSIVPELLLMNISGSMTAQVVGYHLRPYWSQGTRLLLSPC